MTISGTRSRRQRSASWILLFIALPALAIAAYIFASSSGPKASPERFSKQDLIQEVGLRWAILREISPDRPDDKRMRVFADYIGVTLNPLMASDSTTYLIEEVTGQTAPDDRKEVEDAPAGPVQDNARAVCAIVDRRYLEKVSLRSGESGWRIKNSRPDFDDRCSEEVNSFCGQPCIAAATGFLVNDSTVATVSHALDGFRRLKDFVVIFDFKTKKCEVSDIIPGENVFFVDSVRRHEDCRVDWALLELAELTGRDPVELDMETITCGLPVYLIGHGEGLPLKYSANAKVTRIDRWGHLKASLDAFNHDSGAPVFRVDNDRVVGIVKWSPWNLVWASGARCKPSDSPWCKARFVYDPECPGDHTTVYPISDFFEPLDIETTSQTPPPCTASTSGPVPSGYSKLITIRAIHPAIVRAGCNAPLYLSPDSSLALQVDADVVDVLRCEANGCDWKDFPIKHGGSYDIVNTGLKDFKFVPSSYMWLTLQPALGHTQDSDGFR